MGIYHASISSVCGGNREFAGGFKWEYVKTEIPGEEWKKYKDIQVSNKGRIICINGLITYGTKTDMGYKTCTPIKGGKAEFVHRAVAIAFISNSLNLPVVNHIDGNKSNNCTENLSWVTYKENTKHAFENGLIKEKRKRLEVIATFSNGEKKTYKNMDEAAKDNNCCTRSIRGSCNGEIYFKTVKGISFKYKERQ